MSGLQPADFLSRIATIFFPRTVMAHLRTEVLENGQVEVTPVFTIDGHEVPAESVRPEKYQSILGYGVTLDDTSLHVQKATKARRTRLTKHGAVGFIERMERSGVHVRSRNGKVRPRIARARPDLSLDLRPDESLAVGTVLASEDGIVLSKPNSLEGLKEDGGWYAVGDDLMMLPTTGTSIDDFLISPEAATLTGDEVPRLLKLVQDHRKALGHVEKNEALRDLSVFGERWENRATAHGDAESVSISTSLTFYGPGGKRYEESLADLEAFEEGGGYRRVPEGWIEVTPGVVKRHHLACRELDTKLGSVSDLRGANIPRTLSGLVQASRKDGGWESPWAVYFSQAVQESHRIIETPAAVEFRLNIVESDGRSLLELDPIYNHERFRLSHAEAEAVAEEGEEWVRRGDAWIKVDVGKYRKIAAEVEKLGLGRTPTGFMFPASQREQVVERFSTLGSIQHSAAYAEFLVKLANFEKIEDVPLPDTLRPEIRLRPYQQHGYNWLAFLHRFGLNGILADDMGLGKTLQCLAAIQRAREVKNDNLPSLVICPTSVVNNWKSEAYKFFTDITVIAYTGTAKDREAKSRRIRNLLKCSGADPTGLVVVTTYDIARRDHEALGCIPWLYVVVDEGHMIKNPDAVRTKAIKTINGRHKLALTGTPVQNNLEELWSLFDFAMPGFLGSRSHFRDLYGKNGKVNWDAVRGGKAPLKERINPFVLRRLKGAVAPDLPPKTVVERKVELTMRQVELYKRVIEGAACKRLFDEVAEKGIVRAKPQILSAYTSLRAICNHPALADGYGGGPVKCSESGKLSCLMDLMEEVVEGEHRALLFCQSTKMLDIIESHFTKQKVCLLRLDGSTPPERRPGLVERFNGDESIDIFLISTRAGGTGLNLTGADTVVFYDHDWNPANDNQAQDRAHRIGQTRPVTVYKLASQGTIEEKIIERQAIKQTMADEIVGEDVNGFKELTPEELLALFKLDLDSGG